MHHPEPVEIKIIVIAHDESKPAYYLEFRSQN
jgi:hypothetical protein